MYGKKLFEKCLVKVINPPYTQIHKMLISYIKLDYTLYSINYGSTTDTTWHHSTQNKPSSFIVDSSRLSFSPCRLTSPSVWCSKIFLLWIFPSIISNFSFVLSLFRRLVAAFRLSSSWNFFYKMNTHLLWNVSAEINERHWCQTFGAVRYNIVMTKYS